MDAARHFRGARTAPSIALGLVIALAAALAAPVAAFAADPPANDNFLDAEPLVVSPWELPQTFSAVDIASATTEEGERWPCAPAGSVRNSVWYTFTYGSVREGYVQVDAPGATVTAFYLLRGSTIADLSAGYCKGTSRLVIPWASNRTDYVQITWDGSTSPIDVTFSWVPVPANDNLASAESVVLDPHALAATTTGDTRLASIERAPGGGTMPASYDIPWCGWSSVTFARSVWYSFSPPASGTVRIEPAESAFADLALTVFRGLPTDPWSTRLGCASGRQPLTFVAEPYFVYYVQAVEARSGLGGGLSGGGLLELTWSMDLAPTLTVPGNLTAEATSSSGATVTFDTSASDPEDGVLTPTCDRPSGSTFPIGQTAVLCSASDRAGSTTYRGFLVTVRDTVAPTVAYGTHPDTYTVADRVQIPCGASDSVGVATSTCADVDVFGWELGLGGHAYAATATDAAGNVGSATTEFTVVATYGSVSELTKQWVTKAGVAKDLVALLGSAAAAEAKGQVQAEANKLAEYRAMVAAQAGKSISLARAELLVAFSYAL